MLKQSAESASHPSAKALRTHFRRITEQAEANGLSAEAAEALIGIDASVFAWRRRMLKGEMVRNILSALALDIEQAEFEALTALSRLNNGMGSRRMVEVTVGDIAEELTIDPSRASRLVSALVSKGYLRRAAAQSDARKIVLVSTPASLALFDAFMTLKWQLVFNAFKGWNESHIADFERLLSHYVGSLAEAIDKAGEGKLEAEAYAVNIRDAVASELASR
jgi:DNA-binding MarR family transcriptional regulator